ncbi:MAG: hypothetical protein CSA50_04890 [Gammaproteobacteria bacterium]|nr:MAG: hypothetical protein CSA50_04890 [Gammaproteobacteria bacterium]
MEFDFTAYPKKLNLGAGLDRKEGFVNVDLNDCHAPDLVCDVSVLKPLPDDYYDYILAQDILEHLPKSKCQNTLIEWNRVLCIGGKLEIQVPDIIGIFKLFQKPENRPIENQERLLGNLFGTQNYVGDFHYIGFTEELLVHYLSEAGFQVESICVKDEWLFHVIAKKIMSKRCDLMYYQESDEDFIKTAFATVLQRDADPGGLEFYRSILKSGIPRESVVNALKASDEFRQIQSKR